MTEKLVVLGTGLVPIESTSKTLSSQPLVSSQPIPFDSFPNILDNVLSDLFAIRNTSSEYFILQCNLDYPDFLGPLK